MNRKVNLFTILMICICYFSANAQQITSITKANSGLPVDQINSVHVDVNGNKWFGTEGGGLIFLKGKKFVYYNLSSNPAIADNYVNDMAYQLTSGQEDELWLATDFGVTAFRFDVDGITSATSYNSLSEGVSITNDEIISVAVNGSGTRFFGTPNGMPVFKGSTWTILNAESSPVLPEKRVLSLAATADTVYAGYSGIGVFRVYENDVDGFTSATVNTNGYYMAPYNLPSDNVYAEYVDKDGYRWFGTDAGIVRHKGIDGKNTKDMQFTKADGLAGNLVYAITRDSSDNMWFGTGGGVSKMSLANPGVFTNYTTADGLAHNTVYDIACESDDLIWFATAGGISVMGDFILDAGKLFLEQDDLKVNVLSWSNHFNISISSGYPQFIHVELFDISGRYRGMVYSGQVPSGEFTLSMSADDFNLNNGIYLVKVNGKSGTRVKRLIISK